MVPLVVVVVVAAAAVVVVVAVAVAAAVVVVVVCVLVGEWRPRMELQRVGVTGMCHSGGIGCNRHRLREKC